MDDSAQSQRLLLAAILSVAVMLGWYYFFPTPQPPPGAAKRPTIAATKTSTPAALATTTTTATTGATLAIQGTTGPVAEQTFEFRGEVPGADDAGLTPFHLVLSNMGGSIQHFQLDSYRERDKSNQATDEPITLAERAVGPDFFSEMAGLRFSDASFSFPTQAGFQVVDQGPDRVTFRYRAEQVEVEREYRLRKDSFEVEMAVTVRNVSRSSQRYRLELASAMKLLPAMESGGFLFVPPPDHLSGLCFSGGRVRRFDQGSLKKEREELSEDVKWVAIDRQYFVAAIIQRDAINATCRLTGSETAARAALLQPETVLAPGEERRHKFTAYLGVKQPALLTQVDAELEAAVDYTILGLNLALLCQFLLWVLGMLQGVTGSWGAAILGLTVLVKLVLFPLNQRSGRSMRAMAALKPEMDRIREKFPEDRQRQSEELMKLYRQYGVNPASGCLPILLQMPIWFALYRALWVSVDLYQERFLWLPDLTARDPYWILPVALVVVMFVQQKMTPSTMDPAQQKIMLYLMPAIFGLTMAALPGGLAFYILVNSLLTIVQQHFINRSIGPVEGPPLARGATT